MVEVPLIENRECFRILMINHHRRYKSLFRAQVIAEHLVKRGHNVTLVVISDSSRFGIKESVCKGVTIVETPDLLWGKLRSGWDPYGTLIRTKLLLSLDEKFDFLHIFETRPATIVPVLKYIKKKNVPLFIDWIDWWGGKGGLIDVNRPWWYKKTFGRIEEYFEERFRTYADGTTVISAALAERAKALGVPEDSILLLRGGVDIDHFSPTSIDEARRETGIAQDARVLGFSSLDSHLDLKLLMEAVVKVKNNVPGVKVLMTGSANKDVEKLIASFGLEKDVILTGFLPFKDLPLYLSCCDLFMLPMPETLYNVGRWPNKVADYLSIGRPVITNPTGELKEIFASGDIGLTCGYDADEFAESISVLLKDRERAQRMGERARRWAMQNLRWESRVQQLEDFYRQIIKSYAKDGALEIPEMAHRDRPGRKIANSAAMHLHKSKY